MQYIRQLDTIRAFAVFLVIIHHWFPKDTLLHIVPTGPLGVDIFFVLSGFLITAILLRQRKDTGTASVVKSFYWRRALRIFPIYYLAIVMLLIFQQYVNSDMPSAFPYLATYTSNFYFFNLGAWDGAISHLWSLAVEEQFYLVWPWVMLLVPQRWLLHSIILFILVGAGSQYLMQDVALHSVLPFACFDAFGVGALLAWVMQYRPQQMQRFYKATIIAGVAGTFGALSYLFLGLPLLPLRTANALMALWLITYAVTRGEQVQASFLWHNKALIFCGKISYGLYLYHLIVSQVLQPKLVQPLLHPLLPDLLTTRYSALLILAENTALLLVLSMLSYYLIEVKFLKLKRHFGYAAPRAQPTPAMQQHSKLPVASKVMPHTTE
jgi:peptidoglycan/LPS O-acetylase OafA/YrhL